MARLPVITKTGGGLPGCCIHNTVAVFELFNPDIEAGM